MHSFIHHLIYAIDKNTGSNESKTLPRLAFIAVPFSVTLMLEVAIIHLPVSLLTRALDDGLFVQECMKNRSQCS